jgi:hypothetical protein
MSRVTKYILLISILLTALASEAQYIDTVCTNTLGRGYHVFGLPGPPIPGLFQEEPLLRLASMTPSSLTGAVYPVFIP